MVNENIKRFMEVTYCQSYDEGNCKSRGFDCRDIGDNECVMKFRATGSPSSSYNQKINNWISVKKGDATRWKNKSKGSVED